MDKKRLNELKKTAIDVRRDCLYTQRIATSGHIGGSYSETEMLVYLYFDKMNIDTNNPMKEDRDIFIISKGHASLGYYSTLARKGFFPIEELKTYRQVNTRLQGHSHMDSIPGIENSSGSLGQGFSFGIGIALGLKKKGIKSNVYVLVGDGELQEGQNWEAAMLQGNLKLDNLVLIVDNNRLQLDDTFENIMGNSNFKEKFEAFGFNAIEVDGHDFEDIERGFGEVKEGCANVIIANTIKGKGISYMENVVEWHSKKITDEEFKIALEELEKQEVALNE